VIHSAGLSMGSSPWNSTGCRWCCCQRWQVFGFS